MTRWVPALLLAFGCAHRSDALVQPWRAEARTTHGVVRVMPVVATHGPLALELGSYVGPEVPWRTAWLRGRRTEEVGRVPAALGTALPAAVNGALGPGFDGELRAGALGLAERAALRAALRGRGDLDATLSAAGRGVDGSAALFTWVSALDGRPLTARGFAGEIVHTEGGPVVLDDREEPYLVTATIGIALVARDGEVVVRLEDRLSTVLSARRDAGVAARDLARALAEQVARVWACDPRLDDPPRPPRADRAPVARL